MSADNWILFLFYGFFVIYFKSVVFMIYQNTFEIILSLAIIILEMLSFYFNKFGILLNTQSQKVTSTIQTYAFLLIIKANDHHLLEKKSSNNFKFNILREKKVKFFNLKFSISTDIQIIKCISLYCQLKFLVFGFCSMVFNDIVYPSWTITFKN